MPYEPPSDPDWPYVLNHVLPRLGMWTGRETYERAVCFVEGFDLAKGGQIDVLLRDWTHARYGDTSIGWPWVLLRLSLGTSPEDPEWRDLGDLTAEEDRSALALLRQALSDVVTSR